MELDEQGGVVRRQIGPEDVWFWEKYAGLDNALSVYDEPKNGKELLEVVTGTGERYRLTSQVRGVDLINDEGTRFRVKFHKVSVRLDLNLMDLSQSIPVPEYRRHRVTMEEDTLRPPRHDAASAAAMSRRRGSQRPYSPVDDSDVT